MELKEYQQGVLRKLDHYLAVLREKRENAEDFVAFQRSQGKTAILSDYCRDTWDQLNVERVLPMLSHKGQQMIAHYLGRHDGLRRPIPSICLKVPTGGGKTLLATAAVERIQTDYLRRQTGLVLWVVPSDAIYKQTWKHLANREHPYRQMLERASGGRVKMLEKTDAFTKCDIQSQLCVMVLMLPSAARKTQATLRLFRDSGRFTSFFPVEDDSAANQALLDEVGNLDINDLADMGFAEGIVPGSVSVKQSLGNVLRLVRPVIVIDEGHKAYSDTARDTLCGFNPSFFLELSATPNTKGKHQSNVLVNVPGADLKDEEMIKLPINVINEDKGGWKQTLALAHAKQGELENVAGALQDATGRYIRPIVLVRAERTGEKQRDNAFVHAEDVREYLQNNLGVREEEIRLKTSERDELGDDDLLLDTCPVRYIITKDALREGWDCPFAYVLAILSKTTATTALTQMVGRVLRQPHAQLTGHDGLDECFVYTFDQDVTDAVEGVRRGLQDEGMADLASSVKSVDGATGQAREIRQETLRRREKFARLPGVFLPRVLHRDHKEISGYRALDYERDILGELNWDTIQFVPTGTAGMDDEDFITRTVARVSIERKAETRGQTTFEVAQEFLSELPEEGIDFPFLVRQLLDVIPNPWQGARVLEETLVCLRERGVTEEALYTNRLELLRQMKLRLREQVDGMAEQLFRAKLGTGDIALRLTTANDQKLRWELAEELNINVSNADYPLQRRNGSPLERSLFEKVYTGDLNQLEKNTAWYLDESECVKWWHRIAVTRSSYSVQGWQRNKVYPDFLVSLSHDEDGVARFTLLETKGEHLKGNDDTAYKQQLFDLLTAHTDTATPVGELALDDQSPVMSFKMLMESDWKQELAAEGL